MCESNTVVSAFTMYRHLKQYCSHPSIYYMIDPSYYDIFVSFIHRGNALSTFLLENGLNIHRVYSVVVYQKISNEVGRNDNFRALARKLSFLPNEFDIFDIR